LNRKTFGKLRTEIVKEIKRYITSLNIKLELKTIINQTREVNNLLKEIIKVKHGQINRRGRHYSIRSTKGRVSHYLIRKYTHHGGHTWHIYGTA